MIAYVAGFAFSLDGEWVLLIQKERPTWQKGRYNGVGGKIEQGETPVQAMVREFKEETDLDTTDKQWIPLIRIANTNGEWEVYFFFAHLPGLEAARQTTDEALVITASSYVANNPVVLPNLRWLIPMALDVNIKNTFKKRR